MHVTPLLNSYKIVDKNESTAALAQFVSASDSFIYAKRNLENIVFQSVLAELSTSPK